MLPGFVIVDCVYLGFHRCSFIYSFILLNLLHELVGNLVILKIQGYFIAVLVFIAHVHHLVKLIFAIEMIVSNFQ